MADESEKLTVCNHVAAFVDILGQRESLRSFTVMPDVDNPEEMARFKTFLKGTLGVIQGFENWRRDFFATWKKTGFILTYGHELSGVGGHDVYSELSKTAVRVERFTDGMMMFLPIPKGRFPCANVFPLLTACGGFCLLALAARHPIRGGVELGLGAELYPSELYGPVVSMAYELESRVAQYPRIAVGEHIVSYLRCVERIEGTGIEASLNRAMAKCCLELLAVDVDGVIVVDYLGEKFREYTSSGMDPFVIEKALDYIQSQLTQWGERKDTKLVSRYLLLREYFARRGCVRSHDTNSPEGPRGSSSQ